MTQEVSIVGPGLSKFGRQRDVSGRQMAVTAIAAALEDADLTWPDIEIAFGGSDGSGLADTLVAELGFTGIPFTNVKNGCATGASALFAAANASPFGGCRDRPRGGASTNTRAGRSTPYPRTGDCPRDTARPG